MYLYKNSIIRGNLLLQKKEEKKQMILTAERSGLFFRVKLDLFIILSIFLFFSSSCLSASHISLELLYIDLWQSRQLGIWCSIIVNRKTASVGWQAEADHVYHDRNMSMYWHYIYPQITTGSHGKSQQNPVENLSSKKQKPQALNMVSQGGLRKGQHSSPTPVCVCLLRLSRSLSLSLSYRILDL